MNHFQSYDSTPLTQACKQGKVKLLVEAITHWFRVSVPVLSEARTSMPDISSRADSLRTIDLAQLCVRVCMGA